MAARRSSPRPSARSARTHRGRRWKCSSPTSSATPPLSTRSLPGPPVGVPTPDSRGAPAALDAVLAERPEILNHNVETVERLYPRVRPQARYPRSLAVLRRTKERAPDLVCKSGIMVGLGETHDEVVATMRDIAAQGTDVLTVGQYLRPSPMHLPIERYWTPAEFAALHDEGMTMGFRHVESGPLVRSSYHAERHVGLG